MVGAENAIVGEGAGIKKLIQVKTKFRNWLYDRSFLLGFICEFIITDKDIEKAVNWVLITAKQELGDISTKKEEIADFAINTLEQELKKSSAIKNKDVNKIVGNLKHDINDKRGYVQAFAKYNEEEKFSTGVEFGVKF